MFKHITDKLEPTLIQPVRAADAAVLMPLLDDSNPRVLLTVRANHLNNHAGEVAFPGGKVDEGDSSLTHTALRETHEEVGIAASEIKILGQLPQRSTRFGMAVQPFVGLIRKQVTFTPSPAELDSIFEVPLDFFKETQPSPTTLYNGVEIPIISYEYDDYLIWGLTARIIKDFLHQVYE